MLTSANELAVTNSDALNNSGQISAARLDVATGRLDNSGSITQTGLQALAVDSGSLDNSGGYIGYTKADDSNGSSSEAGSNNTSSETTPTTATSSGSINSQTTATNLTLADGRITVTEALTNSGDISANGGIALTAQNGLTNRAELSLNRLTVGGSALDNQSGSISAQQAEITATALDNRQGSLIAADSIRIQNQLVDNQSGTLQSGGNWL